MVYQIYWKNSDGIYSVYTRDPFVDTAFTTAGVIHKHLGLDVFVWDTKTDCIYNYLGEPYPGVFTLSRRIRPEGMEMPKSQPDAIENIVTETYQGEGWLAKVLRTRYEPPEPDVHTDSADAPKSTKFVRLVPRMEEEKPYEEVAPVYGYNHPFDTLVLDSLLREETHVSFGSMEELMAEGDRMYENYRKADWPENVPPPPPDRRIVREWPLNASVEELLSLEADSPDESSHRLRMEAIRKARASSIRIGLSSRGKWYNRFIRWVLRQP